MIESSINKEPTLRVISIVEGTTVDGPGLRTSIYFAGCRHKCKGCHNPDTWSFDAGYDMTVSEIISVIQEADFDVTLSGGDPMYQVESVTELARRIKQECSYNIWLYTGFTYEQIRNSKMLSAILPFVDTIVDGPFIEELKDTSLLFRGSSNQRIIDLH